MKLEDLEAYAAAAIENAQELSDEATLLFEHQRFARAYFLSVAAIEETGKALLAFDAQGRNLSDPAVVSKIRRSLADHSAKIRAAFLGFLFSDPRKNAEIAVKLIVQLQRGREPSMYTDQSRDGTIKTPSKMVNERAALDCVRLSQHCLASGRNHLATTKPIQRTRVEDQVFALKSSDYLALANKEDFWWYYISKLESGQLSYAEAVAQYRQDYSLRGKEFRARALER